jgi:outer membrane receptor protein involved in Fe transport
VYGTETGPYVWTGLHLAIGPSLDAGRSDRLSLLQRWTLSLVVRNLLNTRYALPGGFEHLQDAIEQDGRTVSLQLRARW